MTEHVEARSLASLNQLASNPPQYPTNPAEKRQDPLTLYISRVPGTRDIILSPLKPLLKNVTGEDVANSLYYVHLNSEEDDLFASPEDSKPASSPRSSSESRRVPIQRKPVPVPSYPASTTQESGPADSKVDLVDPASQTTHPALRTDEGSASSDAPPKPQDAESSAALPAASVPTIKAPVGSIRRKPVGPRQNPEEAQQPPDFPVQQPPVYEQVPPLPPRPTSYATSPHSPGLSSPLAPPGPESPSRSPSPTHKRPFKPFSLTLIRRDPSSGQQWNVGKVASFQMENPEDKMADEKLAQASPSIVVHLETSGYAKFRAMPMPVMPIIGADGRPSLDGASAGGGVDDLMPTNAPAGVFERQVKMAYAHSWTANIKHAFRNRRNSRSDEETPASPVNKIRHNRGGSNASIGSFGGDFDGGDAPIITQPAPGLKPKGYVFASPWDGRCEFVTGGGGRSLQCRHVLPNFTGHVFNPLVDGIGGGDEGSLRPRPANAVSELRFSLPSSEVFRRKEAIEGGARARDQIQGQFTRILNMSNNSTDTEGEDDYGVVADQPLDLSLGRERAGGGNSGSRAKMGKLIVAEDGLKMLDLTVAANVGVWWVAWERTYG